MNKHQMKSITPRSFMAASSPVPALSQEQGARAGNGRRSPTPRYRESRGLPPSAVKSQKNAKLQKPTFKRLLFEFWNLELI